MSNDRFAPAEAAFRAGDRAEGIRLTAEQLTLDPNVSPRIYQNFTAVLIRGKLYDQAEHWARVATEHHPRDLELWNILGVALRRLGRHAEGLKALDRAIKINPKNLTPQINRGNILNDLKNPAAIEIFTKILRQQPTNAEHQRSLGRAYWFAGELEKAEMRFNLAVKLKPDYVDAWLDLTSLAADTKGAVETLPVLERAVAALPHEHRMHESLGVMLRRAGRNKEAETYFADLLTELGEHAWIHYQIGLTLADFNRDKANLHLEKAHELAPDNADFQLALAESYSRTRSGDEAANLERAYQLLKPIVDKVGGGAGPVKVASDIFVRVADYDAADALGDFEHLGRLWASNGRHTALLSHLARVRTSQDRDELVHQHRIWGQLVEASVARRPLTYPAPRTPNGKIRVGFMSSDLRAHPVAYFSLPLFEHYDREKFEVYCYSYYTGQEDPTQKRIADMVQGFRWNPDISDRDAAQVIADDQLDMLIELGGSTHMNKITVMGYKPAPIQASWLGYPHSAGLKAIDYLIVDPFMLPEREGLLIEKPLVLPHGWFALSAGAFNERVAVQIPAPVTRNGYVTFGTANNPYKYSRDMVRTWAKAVAQVPNSKFMFVRPEGGSESFRKNLAAIFAEEGVSVDRLRFEAVRGAHLPFYNEMDISLDSFPQTGGTTTCESLWMGVPVITLVGETLFERLSYSSLMNGGLPELCARDTEGFIAAAVKLGKDPDRINELRAGLRERMRASPIGQTTQFAHDFFGLIEKAVKG
ncbi:O-linked N-acetylglucosamine transferase, SPINDLY family protein [Phenylobacterium ferrooxidans]|uniref:protein O-GlcNAc transferase n=1 Tax=Phenylobacterium ferrooxidans TaxID=2982689 RepID=A0ABW6CPZ2_9CAUL